MCSLQLISKKRYKFAKGHKEEESERSRIVDVKALLQDEAFKSAIVRDVVCVGSQ